MDVLSGKCVIFLIWKFTSWRNSVIITHLIDDTWDKVCSKTNSFKHEFTKTGCIMTAYGASDILICPQKFLDNK